MPGEILRKSPKRRFSEEAKTAIYGNAMLSLMTDTMTIQDIALVGMVDDEFRNQDILIAGDKLTTRIEVERLRWRGIHVRLIASRKSAVSVIQNPEPACSEPNRLG